MFALEVAYTSKLHVSSFYITANFRAAKRSPLGHVRAQGLGPGSGFDDVIQPTPSPNIGTGYGNVGMSNGHGHVVMLL